MNTLEKKLFLATAALLSCLLISSCSSLKGNEQDGVRWYKMHNCFACHGSNGDDGKGPKIRNLDMGYRTFRSIVRDAGSPIMPKFPETKISDQDIADIFAWLNKD